MSARGLTSMFRALVAVACTLFAGCALAQTTNAAMGPVTYFQSDLTGNVAMATDPSGNVLWEERYLPYGGKRLGTSGGTNGNSSGNVPLGFHTKAGDPETGLRYFGSRFYDPTIARFLGMDSAQVESAKPHTFNRYSFARDNPYRYTDNDGRVVIDIIFVAYDVYTIATEGATTTNLIATGLDIASTFGVGFGAGEIYRAGHLAVEAGHLAVEAEHATEAARATGEAVANGKRAVEAAKSGETLATKAGRQAHKDWDAGEGFEKEVTLRSGKRADAVNFEEKHVKELKPNNPRAVKRGEKQVEGYRKELQEEHGGTWTSSVETYGP